MNHELTPPDHVALLELVNDVAASIAFSTLVTDAAGAAVIHVDGSTTNQLVISITNQTSSGITVAQLSGAASSGNCNLLLKLPNDQLYFYDAPTIDGASTPGTWELATDAASGGAGWVDTIYLANTGACKLSPNGTAGDTLSVVINYSGAVPDDPKALNIPVQVSYLNIATASGTPLTGTTPAQTMGLMANAGRPSPLVGSFVGPQTVLNDGTTSHDLTLRLVNTSLDPLPFIVPPSGQPTQSYIEVTLPVSDVATDAVWALCDTASWGLINVAMAGSASTGWSPNKSATTPGHIKLEPDFSTVTNIPAGGVLELQLSGVVSGLEPGVVQVQVELNRFALIGTQAFGAALEKSPLVYNNGLGAGMTLSGGSLGANTALNITGDTSGALQHITQSGSGPALQVDGGDVNLSNALSAASATMSGAVTADSVAANSAAISGNLTAGTAAVSGVLTAASAAVSGALSADSVTANSAAVNGGLTANSATVSGALSANTISTNGATVNGSLTTSYATINNGMSVNGFIKFCDAPDYSKGTVGIGGTVYNNYVLTLTTNQSTGGALCINAENAWYAIWAKGNCSNVSGSWTRISDMRLKEEVQSFNDGLDKILQINPIKYRHIKEANLGNEEHIGVSAQELENIAPYMVGKARLNPEAEDEYLSMDSGPLNYMLINAVKELNDKIEALDGGNKSSNNNLSILQKVINKLKEFFKA